MLAFAHQCAVQTRVHNLCTVSHMCQSLILTVIAIDICCMYILHRAFVFVLKSSLIHVLQDYDLRCAAHEYVNSTRVMKGIKNMTIQRFMQFMNWYIAQHNREEQEKLAGGDISEAHIYHTISHSTAHNWLTKYMGLKYLRLKPGIYKDGHERPDVIQDRKKYVEAIMALKQTGTLVQVIRKDIQNPITGKTIEHVSLTQNDRLLGRPIVRVWQDECIVRSGDAQTMAWTKPGYEYGVPKSENRGLMLSLFYNDLTGTSVGTKGVAARIIKYGKGGDGYWTHKDMIQHVTDYLEDWHAQHGTTYKLLFIFDNSSGHCAAGDSPALSLMNVSDGGKQPLFEQSIEANGKRVLLYTQKIEDNETVNVPKGLWRIACELGVVQHDKHYSKAELIDILSQFECFEKKPKLQRVIEAYCHMCMFLPKFHCELNPVERVFSVIKRFVRERCTYKMDGLTKNLSLALQCLNINQLRRFSHRCDRYIAAYSSGVPSKDMEDVVKCMKKKYKSHRKVHVSLDEYAVSFLSEPAASEP